MLRLGILGYPLEHTLSPVMHTAALQQLNINGEFKVYEISESELSRAFDEFKNQGIRGLSVTIPYKNKIIPLIDTLSLNAQLANAVNTITIEPGGKTIGDNTDIVGFWSALLEEQQDMVKNVAVLGCGGAASAVCIALLQNKANEIKIFARNKTKLKQFNEFIDSKKEKLNSNTKIGIDSLSNVDLSNIDLLVNTTPIGMYPNINNSPLEKEKLSLLPKDALVYDLVYNPQETKLLKDAKSLNKDTLNGVEMLVRQGAAALSLWIGKEVSALGAMRLAVEESLEITV